MDEDTQKHRNEFNTLRHKTVPDAPHHPVVNLIIDIQRNNDTQADQKARADYLRNASEGADKLRQQGIPSIWICIGEKYGLDKGREAWSPDSNAGPRSPEELQAMGFYSGKGPDEIGKDGNAFDEFIAGGQGPRADEAVYSKVTFDSFINRDALHSNPGMGDHMRSAYPPEYQDRLADLEGLLENADLADHLKNLGVQKVTIMGGNAGKCVPETAIGASVNGIQSEILTDHLMSHSDPNHEQPPEELGAEVRRTIAEVTDQPRDPSGKTFSKGYHLTDTQIDKVKADISLTTLDNFLSRHPKPEQKADVSPVRHRAGHGHDR